MTANQIFLLTFMLFSLVQFIACGIEGTGGARAKKSKVSETGPQELDLTEYQTDTDNMGYSLPENNPYVASPTQEKRMGKAKKALQGRISDQQAMQEMESAISDSNNMGLNYKYGFGMQNGGTYPDGLAQDKRKGNAKLTQGRRFTDARGIQGVESPVKNMAKMTDADDEDLFPVVQGSKPAGRSKPMSNRVVQRDIQSEPQAMQSTGSTVAGPPNRRKKDGITTLSNNAELPSGAPKFKGAKVTPGKQNLSKLSDGSVVPGRNSPVNAMESFGKLPHSKASPSLVNGNNDIDDYSPEDDSEMADEDQGSSEFMDEIDKNLPGMPTVVRIFATIFKAVGAFMSAIKQILRGPLPVVNTGQPQPNQYQPLQSVVNTGRPQANQFR